MRLYSVEIEGYRSIKGKLNFVVDPKITVVLGANDHGKTNLLDALTHLNPEIIFKKDDDLSFDKVKYPKNFPSLTFKFKMDGGEEKEFKSFMENRLISHLSIKNSDESEERRVESEEKLADYISEIEKTKKEISVLESELPTLTEQMNANPQNQEISKTHREKESEVSIKREIVLNSQKKIDDLNSELEKLEEKSLGHAVTEFSVLKTAEDDDRELIDIVMRFKEEYESAIKKRNALREKADSTLAEIDELKKANKPTEAEALEKELVGIKKELGAAENDLTASRRRGILARKVSKYFEKNGELDLNLIKVPSVKVPSVPPTIEVKRVGVDGGIKMPEIKGVDEDIIYEFFRPKIPRVEIISPFSKVYDSVSRDKIEQNEYSFMRGIFYYAGLEREEWDEVFDRNHTSMKRLEEASKHLNTVLKESWSQGQDLDFELIHDSEKKNIDLVIKDPAVGNRYVPPSKRSSGFTHFFTLKTILRARETEAPARSYIWLFDEPGVHLHPEGQHDLLQVMETLGANNQVIYSTHSLFLINKNFPTRHRLLVKDETGTRMDGKPYSGQWRAAIEALGYA